MKKKLIAGILTGIVAFAALTGCGGAQTQQAAPAQEEATEEAAAEGEVVEEKGTITVAATAVPHAEILEEAKKILAQQGWNLEITVFDDYVQPNLVVNDGDIDANYFQHQPYLDQFNEEQGTDLVSVGWIHYEPLGVYAGKSSD
ncbi:MAG: metal ABC transporter substrate-binding protein, partial [Lachnospiraceae bacterium]|nr:metal ABC transporter substrate-binding protein [Lachnospiraceae bacterium]